MESWGRRNPKAIFNTKMGLNNTRKNSTVKSEHYRNGIKQHKSFRKRQLVDNIEWDN
jgi:hypothetical protein